MDRRQLDLARQVPLRHRDLGHPKRCRPGPCLPRELLKPAFPSLAEGCRGDHRRIRHRSSTRTASARTESGAFPTPARASWADHRPRSASPILAAHPRYGIPRTPARWRSSCFGPVRSTDSPKCRIWICKQSGRDRHRGRPDRPGGTGTFLSRGGIELAHAQSRPDHKGRSVLRRPSRGALPLPARLL